MRTVLQGAQESSIVGLDIGSHLLYDAAMRSKLDGQPSCPLDVQGLCSREVGYAARCLCYAVQLKEDLQVIEPKKYWRSSTSTKLGKYERFELLVFPLVWTIVGVGYLQLSDVRRAMPDTIGALFLIAAVFTTWFIIQPHKWALYRLAGAFSVTALAGRALAVSARLAFTQSRDDWWTSVNAVSLAIVFILMFRSLWLGQVRTLARTSRLDHELSAKNDNQAELFLNEAAKSAIQHREPTGWVAPKSPNGESVAL